MFSRCVESTSWLILHWTATPPLSSHTVRPAPEKHILCPEMKATSEKKTGHPAWTMVCFYSLWGTCGKRWLWELISSMLRQASWRYITNSWEISWTQALAFFREDGTSKMAFLLKSWWLSSALDKKTWLQFCTKASKIGILVATSWIKTRLDHTASWLFTWSQRLQAKMTVMWLRNTERYHL